MHKKREERISVWQSEMLHRKGRQGKGKTANEGNQSLAIAEVERINMNLNVLARKVRREARRDRRRGVISREEYEACYAVTEDWDALEQLNRRVEAEVNPWNQNGLVGADWREWLANLWDWFKENWPEILRIILTIAPLLLLEPEDEDR